MARTASKSTPVIISKTLYSDDELTGTQIDSDSWKAWISRHQTFNFEGATVRAEQRRGHGYSWYAFKKITGKLHKVYIGRDESIILATLEKAVQNLADKSSGADHLR